MRGQDRIIASRLHGRAPAVGVYVEISDSTPWFDWRETKTPGFPVLWIEPGDDPSRLDLRCVVGLRVCVAKEDHRDWKPVAEACVKAGASHVYAFEPMDGRMAMVWSSDADHS